MILLGGPQINVVVGAFFVISGYVAAYTTTTLGQHLG
jgi:peptidoglycan/LPS O-acetylase OafA/YrhL